MLRPLSWLSFLLPVSRQTQAKQRWTPIRLQVESLEDRLTPSGSYLLAASFDTDHLPRYDGANGAFVDDFITRRSGGLIQPYGIVFGPHDHNLYVTSGQFGGTGQLHAVLRYDAATGAPLGVFAGDHLNSPRGIIFGPDGNLYVSDFTGPAGGRVVRFNGRTGAFLDEFVSTGIGGLRRSQGLVFGPDANHDGLLDLYVASATTNSVLHYDGVTGTYLGEFVPSGSGGLDHPTGLTFGPDGNLYVSNYALGNGHTAVLRFQGPSGRCPGAPLPGAGNGGADFVSVGAGGLRTPFGVLFGPDGNGDGRQDLYVTSCDVLNDNGSLKAKQNTNTVRRYDGWTGAFIDTFVSVDSGGLRDPALMTFTETDPVTLAYRGGDQLTAASLPAKPIDQTLGAEMVRPLLTEALTRWQASGVDTSDLLGNIQIQITNLGGATLGLTSGHTIYLDDNAAGWGWFVDRTPRNDSEFRKPGNRGEQGRMDLLTVIEHEVGHLLGREHELTGVMIDTLPAGTRRTPASDGIETATRLDGRDLFLAFLGADGETIWAGNSIFGRGHHRKR